MGGIQEYVANQKQQCPTCSALRVKPVTRTTMVVYLRCEPCGYTWAIPERRRLPRASDPKGF